MAIEPAISIVIPVRNDADRLRRCLASITATTREIASEIIVVDNGSVDDTVAVAAAAGCRVLQAPHQRVGALRNLGAKAANAPLLAFIDSDHEVVNVWASAAIEVMRERTVAAVGTPYTPPMDANWVQRAYDGLRDHAAGFRIVEWLGSGNLVVRRDTFDTIGGFDTTLEACEDVDFCRRVRENGGFIANDSRLRSIHFGDPASLSALFKSELWRGRNNLQVSLRERPSLRSLPSILIPVFQLVLGAMTVASLAFGRPLLATACLVALILPSLARSARIRTRARVPLHHAAVVAITYDIARAVALLVRARHRRADVAVVTVPQ